MVSTPAFAARHHKQTADEVAGEAERGTDPLAYRVLLELHPAPGVSARVERDGYGVHFRQGDNPQFELADPGGREGADLPDPVLTEVDVDFDGYKDLIVRYPDRPAEEGVEIIRYRPALDRYDVLGDPDVRPEPMDCPMVSPTPDLASRQLRVTCHRGDTVETEGIAFDASGRSALVYRKLESTRKPVPSDPSPDFSWRRTGVFGEITRWDQTGREIEQRAYSAQGGPVEATVRVARAHLFRDPSGEGPGAGYLVAGDKLRVIAQRHRWLRVVYAGKAGPIDRWVDAAAFAPPDALAPPPEAPRIHLQAVDYSGATKDAAYFHNLLTFMLVNDDETPVTIEGSLVLSFRSVATGKEYSEGLYRVEPLTVPAGATQILEDNPIENHRGRYVLFHEHDDLSEGWVPVFPYDMPPGRYEVRPVIYAEAFDGPVPSDNAITIDYPPQLPPSLIKDMD